MAVRKGGSLHRAAGNVFFVAMLTMAGVGAAVAPFLPREQVANTLVGVFTVYLVATGWAAVRRGAGRLGAFERAAALVIIFVAGALAAAAWIGAHSPGGMGGGVPWEPFVVFGSVAALAAVCDLRVIARGGVSGAGRLTRHLWRMSTALIIAAGSFAGQPKAVPHFLRGSPVLFLPMLAVLMALIWWLVRVRLRGAFKAFPSASPSPTSLLLLEKS
jgi:uncharacterized membrane protein